MSPAEQGNISAWSIRNPVAVTVLFIFLAAAGLAAWPGLRVTAMPDVELPVVQVGIAYPGAAPSEIETQVTRLVEESIAGIGDIRHIHSAVTEGLSLTYVEFTLGRDVAAATADVRDRTGRIRAELPGGILEPVITPLDSSGGAILTYAVSAPGLSPADLSRFVDEEVSRALLGIRGVAEVVRIGGADEEVRVALRPDRLLAHGLGAAEVSAQLLADLRDLPGGRMGLGGEEQWIRALGAAPSLAALAAHPVRLPGGGFTRLDAIAEVTLGTAEVRTAAWLDGLPVVAFEVLRARGSSELAVARAVEARLEALGAERAGLAFTRVAATVTDAEEGLAIAIEALLAGAALAMLVVWLFLRDWSATWICALAMPLSLLPVFAVIALAGFSLNTVTLLGLTLVVGILVDDAIVEVENVVRHLRADPAGGVRHAAFAASAEIGLAVVATTATILAVFVPVAFLPGVPGRFFREFGLTVATAVFFSLVVARMLTPLLAAHALRPGPPPRPAGPLMRGYGSLLRRALDRPRLTLAAGVALLGVSVALAPLIPRDFLAAPDRGRIGIAMELPPGAPLAVTARTAAEATRLIRARPEVAAVFTSLGTVVSGQAGIGASTRTGEPRMANFIVTLVPRGDRALSQRAVEAALRAALADLPGARFRFGADGQGAARLQVTLMGEDPALLATTAAELERQMRGLGRFAAVRSAASLERPELRLVPDAAGAADLGVTTAAIAQTIRIATIGDVASNLPRFDQPGRRVPVRVMTDEAWRRSPETLERLTLATPSGAQVPLAQLLHIESGGGPSRLDRLDRQRRVTVEAETGGMPLGEAVALVDALPVMTSLPAGIGREALGDAATMRELFAGFAFAMAAGIGCVYLVLVLLFGSFLQPLVILAALPLALTGALLALLMTGRPLGLSAVIGLLMLMGIVAKNSILIVEYAIVARRAQGLSARAAAREAAMKRARPVVMTTAAMCAGMAHIAAGIGADAEFRAPMAMVAIGGLLSSTLLSLLVVPAGYVCMAAIEDRIARWRGTPVPLTHPAR